MSTDSDRLVPGLSLTRAQALALPGMRRYRLVEFLIRWEHFGAARELLESLVSQKAGRFFYQYRLAQCLMATGDLERARQIARDLHAGTGTRAVGLLAIGDVLYVEGRLARAEEYYRQALEIEKTRESARRRLAWCLLHRRNTEGAAELAGQLTEGKAPAQLPPAAVRLLAAVAAATGGAERASDLRRELKSRWTKELQRLCAALDLAAVETEREPPARAEREDGAGAGRKSGAAPPVDLAPRRADLPVGADLDPVSPVAVPVDGAPATAVESRALAVTESVAPGAGTADPERRPRTPDTEARTPRLPPSSTGYVYPTARERRAAAQAAAREEAARARPTAGASGSLPPTARTAPPVTDKVSAPAPPVEGVSEVARRARRNAEVTEEAGQSGGTEALPSPLIGSVPSVAGLRALRVTSDPSRVHGGSGSGVGGEGKSTGPSPLTAQPSTLTAALKQWFGYDQFRSGQEEVVRHVLGGRSVLATMPTGRGKSLCFQLPAMLLPRATVVISPLIALMQDQLAGLPPRARERATVLNSSLDSAELERRLREMTAGRYSLVYAAPERLRQRPFLHALSRAGVSLLVVDEAHCISLWGQDFRPDYLFLPKVLEALGRPTLLAMTATAPPAIQEDIRGQFGVSMEKVSQGVFRPNLELSVCRCPDKSAKLKTLRELCREERGAIIVYVSARVRAEHLAQALTEAGVSAGFYHAGLPTELREATQQRFMRGELRCLTATVAFGMGVDKPDIRLIVHHDLPGSLEAYYQAAGRAGRDGEPARCILFASPADKGNLTRRTREDRIAPDDVLRVQQALARPGRDLTLALDDLERETDREETTIRVAISILERVGALRREYDLPRACTLQVLADGDAPFARFVNSARLRPRQRVTRDTGELCALTGIAPDALEPLLLDWVEAGWLDYRGSARGLRLEPQAVPDGEARVRELLRSMAAVDDARLACLDEYVRTIRCRHQLLSDYFGHPLRQGCGVCDNCRGRALRRE